MTLYLDKPAQWHKLVDHIYASKEPIGFDTEFTGVDFDAGNNCVGRSILDVWSLAIFNGELHPRGYERAVGYVLPRQSLEHFKKLLEDESVIKAAHNAIVDIHTMYNAGSDVLGIVDTLHLCRFAFPGKFKYGLDALSKEFLDESKFMSFDDLCSIPAFRTKQVKVKKCDCGEEGCRKRKGHNKYIVIEEVDEEFGTELIPLDSIVPGHERWNDKVSYAAQDAVLALELLDYTKRKLGRLYYENPFR